MRILVLTTVSLFISVNAISQRNSLPVNLTLQEEENLLHGDFSYPDSRGIESPPPFENLRAMAEWEEIQALNISWTSYPGILKQIVKAANEEVMVIILTEDAEETENYLMGNQAGGPLENMDNVTLVEGAFDSVWARDYSGNPVYGNTVDDLVMVDWIYNRPNRPNDNTSPQIIADALGLELYCITEAPTDLVNTGGNFMVDGFGTAFASELILDENDSNNPYDVTTKSEEEIDQIMLDFLGLERYIKMPTLPYDLIHHIDMHMKLIDEETILVGEFPEGVADGPQINANMEYVLSNFNSKWGTPYKVVYVPMVPNSSGLYADDNASYRTYANAVFVNNTVILPTYKEEYDTTAIHIWQDALPGYNIVGIDCDNSPENIISASGAIHCITHAVGVVDPLLISHQPLADTYDDLNPYSVVAYMNHRDGIASGTLYYKTIIDGAYMSTPMSDMGNNNWQGLIPAQAVGTTIFYYVEGNATTGKTQVRPMPAPEGYWSFKVLDESVGVGESTPFTFGNVFPNPAGSITCVPIHFTKTQMGTLKLTDMLSREVALIHSGEFKQGESKFFFDASFFSAGVYLLQLEIDNGKWLYPVMVK